MKKIINVHPTSTGMDIAILIARIGIAAMMLTHGLPKMMMLFSGEPVQFPALFGLGAELSLSLAVFAEVLCSVFLLTGFGTRLAVIPLIITMVVALSFIHASDPFDKQEPAFQYLLVYIILLFTGSGKFSLDYLLQRKAAKTNYARVEIKDPTLSIYR